MTLGKRIAAARGRLKKGQAWLAEEFGVTVQAVSGWERDDSLPEHDKIPKLRQLLRVPYAWLLEGTGEPPPAEDFAVRADDIAGERYEKERLAAPGRHPQKTKKGRFR